MKHYYGMEVNIIKREELKKTCKRYKQIQKAASWVTCKL